MPRSLIEREKCMKRVFGLLPIAGLMLLSATQVMAQQMTANPGTDFAAPGGSFTFTEFLNNNVPVPFNFAPIPFTVNKAGITFVNAAGTPANGQNINYTFAPIPTTLPANSSQSYLFTFFLSNNFAEGLYTNIDITANNLGPGGSPDGAIAIVVATPEYGSVFSLGGLLVAGGTGLWVRRRRSGKAKTEAN